MTRGTDGTGSRRIHLSVATVVALSRMMRRRSALPRLYSLLFLVPVLSSLFCLSSASGTPQHETSSLSSEHQPGSLTTTTALPAQVCATLRQGCTNNMQRPKKKIFRSRRQYCINSRRGKLVCTVGRTPKNFPAALAT